MYTYITNNINSFNYYSSEQECNNPLMNSLILDDEKYLKLCLNYF
jgi:hypothetical protein